LLLTSPAVERLSQT